MKKSGGKVLLLCYGNPGRCDDGLGAAFAAVMEEEAPEGATVEVDYQLTVEDAAVVAEHEVVVFVDAAVRGAEPFFFRKVMPGPAFTFSSHSAAPEQVLGLAEEFFGARTEAYALGIRGYEFDEFGEQLSSGARQNLAVALEFMRAVLSRGDFGEAASSTPGPVPDAVLRER